MCQRTRNDPVSLVNDSVCVLPRPDQLPIGAPGDDFAGRGFRRSRAAAGAHADRRRQEQTKNSSHCGLRIANCGLHCGEFRNPQSAIRIVYVVDIAGTPAIARFTRFLISGTL